MLGHELYCPVPCCSIWADVLVVRGLYAYEAQGPDEIDVEDGGLIQLTEGPNGGRRYGEGWWEGAL